MTDNWLKRVLSHCSESVRGRARLPSIDRHRPTWYLTLRCRWWPQCSAAADIRLRASTRYQKVLEGIICLWRIAVQSIECDLCYIAYVTLSVCLSVCLLVTIMSCTKMAEPIEKPFGYGVRWVKWQLGFSQRKGQFWGHLPTFCKVCKVWRIPDILNVIR